MKPSTFMPHGPLVAIGLIWLKGVRTIVGFVKKIHVAIWSHYMGVYKNETTEVLLK
jgi:hypothetical protein